MNLQKNKILINNRKKIINKFKNNKILKDFIHLNEFYKNKDLKEKDVF